jgi:hypothetical protein
MAYTYQEFENAARAAGQYDRFSTYDLNLARQNPDAGMQILQAKIDWSNATTDAEQSAANQRAENTRAQYGSYYGGSWGMEYNPFGQQATQPAATSFTPSTAGGLTPINAFDATPYQTAPYQSSVNIPQASSFSTAPYQTAPYQSTVNIPQVSSFNANQYQIPTFDENKYVKPAYQDSYQAQVNQLLNQYLSTPKFEYTQVAPTYTSQYDAKIAELLDAYQNMPEFSYQGERPTYESAYKEQLANMLSGIINRGAFSYDYQNDPSYQAYAKQYRREGDRARANAMAAASAMSGGIPSSYALTAASQAGDYYNSQLADRIPQLEAQAYNRYMNDYTRDVQNYGLVQGAEASDYDRYLNALTQYNTDRGTALNEYLAQRAAAADTLGMTRQLEQDDYAKYLAALGQYNTDRNAALSAYQVNTGLDYDKLTAAQRLQQAEYARYLDALNQYNTDRSFGYGVHRDNVGDVYNQRDFAYRQLLDDIANAQWQETHNYGQYRDTVSDNRYNQEFAYRQLLDDIANAQWQESQNYGMYRDTVGDNRYSQEFAYQQLIDAHNQAQALDELAFRQDLAMQEFAHNKDQDLWERDYKNAVLAADTAYNNAALAARGRSGGSYSGGGEPAAVTQPAAEYIRERAYYDDAKQYLINRFGTDANGMRYYVANVLNSGDKTYEKHLGQMYEKFMLAVDEGEFAKEAADAQKQSAPLRKPTIYDEPIPPQPTVTQTTQKKSTVSRADKAISNDNSSRGVYVEGYGQVSYADLDSMVAAGLIIRVKNKDGTITYIKA